MIICIHTKKREDFPERVAVILIASRQKQVHRYTEQTEGCGGKERRLVKKVKGN